jgi:uncharacterized protein
MAGLIEIRDPVHRTIGIDDEEKAVVDHPWVQRLRHIRQLGFVSLVYPGAVHDRFQHSLGVLHVASAFFDQLVERCRDVFRDYADSDLRYGRRVLRLAGLLHDTGHAPFSHTSERFLPPAGRIDLPRRWYRAGALPLERPATHLDLTLAVVGRLAEAGVLPEPVAQDTAAVLSPEVEPGPRLAALGGLTAILRSLISGEIDADRCDYLLRDSHYTGVSYGIYDLPRLMSCLRALDGPDGPELGLDVQGVHAFESLLMARYHMFLQVYFHKTPPAFEHYLARALEEGEVRFPLDHGLGAFLELQDGTVWEQLRAARDRGLPWSRRILERVPAKLVLREWISGPPGLDGGAAQRLVAALRAAGCDPFVCRSCQVFTRIAGAGSVEEGTRLLCERRLLGRPILEPVTRHSVLLATFNRPIDLQQVYVLREEHETAVRIAGALADL